MSLPNTNLLTLTDLYGRFELYLPTPAAVVNINYIGYSDTTLTLAQGMEDVVVMLDEGPMLNEVVVTGATLKQTKYDALSGNAAAADNPVFNHFIESNSRIPIVQNFNQSGKGVTLEFTIHDNGRPQNIKAKSAHGRRYEEEAIRLLKYGPDWMCAGQAPCVLHYTIYFQ